MMSDDYEIVEGEGEVGNKEHTSESVKAALSENQPSLNDQASKRTSKRVTIIQVQSLHSQSSSASLETQKQKSTTKISSEDEQSKKLPLRKRWLAWKPGWRKGLVYTTSLAALVLLFNSIWVIITVTRAPFHSNIYSIYQGNCSKASTIDSVLHVAINILSTCLLGASNYAMQCLGSPTREDVDSAHGKERWVSIGVINMMNLRWIPWYRGVLFGLLMVTAWPLHTVWNSITFSTRQTNVYSILIVSPNFIISSKFDSNLSNLNVSGGFSTFNGSNFSSFAGNITQQADPRFLWPITPSLLSKTYSNFNPIFNSSTSFLSFASSLYSKSKDINQMQYLNRSECIKEYSQTFLTGRRNLLVVANTTALPLPAGQAPGNGSILAYLDSRSWDVDISYPPAGVRWNPGAWICSSPSSPAASLTIEQNGQVDLNCNTPLALQNDRSWTITSQFQNQTYEVDHCLSELVPEKCEVQFALPLMWTVIGCNVVKVVCMGLAILSFKREPLTVLGDAMASFLERGLVGTEPTCASGVAGVKKSRSQRRAIGKVRKWTRKRKRWTSVARKSWCLTLFLSLVTISWSVYLLQLAITQTGASSFSSLTFGEVSASALLIIYGDDGNASPMLASQSISALIEIILLINSPQVVFSTLYFLYNRVFTIMLAMQEWTNFAIRRQNLRVSHPKEGQWSTYWLQLPYQYSVPLLVVSGLMHWIISQSFFLVRVEFLDQLGQPIAAIPKYKPTPNKVIFTPGELPRIIWPDSEPVNNILTVPGYSPKAILAAIVVGGVMVLVLFGNVFRKYKSAMPLPGSNSWEIGKACRQLDGEEANGSENLMWGVMRQPDENRAGFCGFGGEVGVPVVGSNYENCG